MLFLNTYFFIVVGFGKLVGQVVLLRINEGDLILCERLMASKFMANGFGAS